MDLLAIYGSGGFAREVLGAALASAQHKRLVVLSDLINDNTINGVKVFRPEEYAREFPGAPVVIAVADWKVRRQLVGKCKNLGLSDGSVSAKSVVNYGPSEIGPGAILCEHAIITSNVKIGSHFHANLFSFVAHDSVIGDFVTFAPRVSCNGNIIIGDNVYVGTSACIKQGIEGKPLRIGEGAVIGMGAVVTKDVPAGAVVVGNPARPIAR